MHECLLHDQKELHRCQSQAGTGWDIHATGVDSKGIRRRIAHCCWTLDASRVEIMDTYRSDVQESTQLLSVGTNISGSAVRFAMKSDMEYASAFATLLPPLRHPAIGKEETPIACHDRGSRMYRNMKGRCSRRKNGIRNNDMKTGITQSSKSWQRGQNKELSTRGVRTRCRVFGRRNQS